MDAINLKQKLGDWNIRAVLVVLSIIALFVAGATKVIGGIESNSQAIETVSEQVEEHLNLPGHIENQLLLRELVTKLDFILANQQELKEDINALERYADDGR